ncbi:MAG: type II toxin-antitoxin system PemK/MazF family toxin [Chloroflexi bacterium]|nr:type II toxin-antitoxin system PemK/MazF family toxin [Chloroflexota bacterium]
MERGEIRWFTFTEPDKTRPVLILTRSSAIRYLNAVIVAPITTAIRNVPSEVQLSVVDGMMTDCAANFYNLQTVPKTKIGTWITMLSPQRMAEVNKAMQFALGIDSVSNR